MGGFNKELAKKVSLQTISGAEGPSDSQGVEIKSPGKQFWFTIKGETYEDLIEVQTVALHDPDGELLDYVVQVADPALREKIFNKADDNNSTKLILRCQNWFGTEFLWTPSIATKLSKQSIFKALERGMDNKWIKCKWKSNSIGWQSWSHPGTDKLPEWSKMTDEEIVTMVFDGRIIESLDHEALIRNVGGKV
jgi:hypothetical protein